MAQLTDYPEFRDGDYYVVAMAGGDGEEAQRPIREHVKADRYENAKWNTLSDEEEQEIFAVPLERWVDLLSVWRGDNEVAYWNNRDGWVEKSMWYPKRAVVRMR